MFWHISGLLIRKATWNENSLVLCTQDEKTLGKKLLSCHTLKLCIEGFDLVEEITDRDAPIQNIASL